MKQKSEMILADLIQRYPPLKACGEEIGRACLLLINSYQNGGKLLICGNGGSAADADHIVGEMMKGFKLRRNLPQSQCDRLTDAFPEDGCYLANHLQGALPAISLIGQTALSSAFVNDVAADMVFAQQVFGYGKPGDVLMGLSTSGNSKNVVNAVKVAKAFGLKTISLTGISGGAIKGLCDVTIQAPATETFQIQEYHLPVYHALCAATEAEFFD